MGSRISRPSEPFSIFSSPHLPVDIYLDIVNHLQTSLEEDRKALLSLALSCRALRDASQRVLFRNMRYGYRQTTDADRRNLTLKIHAKFLRAIVGSPDRLALYVFSYAQNGLALQPKSRSIGTLPVCLTYLLEINVTQPKRSPWTTGRTFSSGDSPNRPCH